MAHNRPCILHRSPCPLPSLPSIFHPPALFQALPHWKVLLVIIVEGMCGSVKTKTFNDNMKLLGVVGRKWAGIRRRVYRWNVFVAIRLKYSTTIYHVRRLQFVLEQYKLYCSMISTYSKSEFTLLEMSSPQLTRMCDRPQGRAGGVDLFSTLNTTLKGVHETYELHEARPTVGNRWRRGRRAIRRCES